MVEVRQTGLTRQLLGKFLSDPQTIKAFENLSLNTDDLAGIISQMQSAAILVLSLTDTFENERVVSTDGEVQLTDGGPGGNLTFGLSNTGVTAGSYGDASHTVQIAINDKGRITLAQSHALNSDNVTEGGSNLYFTNSRARSALSSGTGISYNSTTGQIAVSPKLAAYDGGDTPSAFTLSIVDSADAAAWQAAIGVAPSSRSISTGVGLVGGGNLTADRTLSLATSGVTAGSYGSATKVPTLSVDVYGRVTIASENTIPALASGTYTPTLTNTANVSASTAYVAQYLRVGNVVHVSGLMDIDPITTGVQCDIGVSLPIPSDFTTSQQCGGSIEAMSVQQSGGFLADPTNDRARAAFIAGTTANGTMSYTFSYLVM